MPALQSEDLTSDPQGPRLTMPRTPLKIGDVVVLRSGSEPFCVADIHKNGSVKCAWYDAQKCKLNQASLHPDALRLANPAPSIDQLVAYADLIKAAKRASDAKRSSPQSEQ